MAAYKPRKCSKRWLDADCPDGVLAILDNKGQSFDRYTVFYSQPVSGTTFSNMWLGYRSMSENPYHPHGFGIYSEMRAYEVARFRYRWKHQYAKWSSLPEAVKRCVVADLAETDFRG